MPLYMLPGLLVLDLSSLMHLEEMYSVAWVLAPKQYCVIGVQ